jgi:MEDS: MEthanogen/methylotroph, DcmR Sensory domain
MVVHGKHSGLATTGTVTLADSALRCPCHVCALYRHPEEQYAALIPFVKEGLAVGDRVFTIVDPREREERINRFRHAGIDVDHAARNGQLDIQTWDQVYLADGYFDVDAILGFAQETITTGRQLGFKRMRGWGNMEWALQDAPGVEQLAIYESRMNYILPLYGEASVCAYDVTRFPRIPSKTLFAPIRIFALMAGPAPIPTTCRPMNSSPSSRAGCPSSWRSWGVRRR